MGMGRCVYAAPYRYGGAVTVLESPRDRTRQSAAVVSIRRNHGLMNPLPIYALCNGLENHGLFRGKLLFFFLVPN